MADLQGRLSPACLEEFEDESLDPRIQVVIFFKLHSYCLLFWKDEKVTSFGEW